MEKYLGLDKLKLSHNELPVQAQEPGRDGQLQRAVQHVWDLNRSRESYTSPLILDEAKGN